MSYSLKNTVYVIDTFIINKLSIYMHCHMGMEKEPFLCFRKSRKCFKEQVAPELVLKR